jgi:hypothetical protein
MRKKTREDHQRDGEVAINIAALALAKNAIKEGLRSQGLRSRLIKPDEIKAYLEAHPALWFAAWERAWHSGQIDESVGVILREIYRRLSVPELWITPNWPDPLPERGVRRKKKEPPKPEPKPNGVAMPFSLVMVCVGVIGLAWWLVS